MDFATRCSLFVTTDLLILKSSSTITSVSDQGKSKEVEIGSSVHLRTRKADDNEAVSLYWCCAERRDI